MHWYYRTNIFVVSLGKIQCAEKAFYVECDAVTRVANFPLNFLSRETGIPEKWDFFPGKSREI